MFRTHLPPAPNHFRVASLLLMYYIFLVCSILLLYFLCFSFDDLTKIVYRNRSWHVFESISINDIRTHDLSISSLTTRPDFRPYYFYSTDWISDSRKRLFDFRRDAPRGTVRWSSPPRQNWLRNHDFCRQTILKVKYHP